MAAEDQNTEVVEETADAEYASWLASLEEDDEPEVAAAEAEVEHEEVAAMKVAKAAAAKSDKLERDIKVSEMERKFESGASADAKRIYDVWRKGDETPEQLKKLMQLAEAKASETAPQVDEETVEKVAAQRAQSAYGVAPLDTSQQVVPEDEWEKKRQYAKKTGDTHTFFELWNAAPRSPVSSTPE